MAQEDTTMSSGLAAVRPVMKSRGSFWSFPYAFPRHFHQARLQRGARYGRQLSVGSAIYGCTMRTGVKTIVTVAATPNPIRASATAAWPQREGARPSTWWRQGHLPTRTTRATSPWCWTPIVKLNPDLPCSRVAWPSRCWRSAWRELGHQGAHLETAQDKVSRATRATPANGFISGRRARTPDIRSRAMEEFIDRYTKKFGAVQRRVRTPAPRTCNTSSTR